MQGTEFETDDLLKLLTEALRRGPGSPQWHEAIEKLRDQGIRDADEYRLLMTVRERLQSGQSYREVWAGPAFTRELMQRIREESILSSGKSRILVWVSVVCLVLLIGSSVTLVSLISRKPPPPSPGDYLSQQLFLTPVKAWNFETTFPEDLSVKGDLKLSAFQGLHFPKGNRAGYASVLSEPVLDFNPSVCVELQIMYYPSDDGSVSVTLVSGSEPTSVTGLTVALSPTGYVVTQGQETRLVSTPLSKQLYTLRIKLSASMAVIEVNGQTIWTGEHQLSSPGVVRLDFTKNGKDRFETRVHSLRILKP
ncbi:MAG: hypothetical protein KatS3mg104_1437 [Phycisphaerae bacterium]|jgi:hypothetical protein|nr:MAG: hypothetical protein KatS3mg104_1437 [Phycisphaerae bacterium]